MNSKKKEPLYISLTVIGSILLMVFTLFRVSIGNPYRQVTLSLPVTIPASVPVQSQLSQAAGYDTGMVAHWNFDEGSGTTAGDTAGSFNGTINGASWVSGVVGSGALSFNGTNNKVQTGFNPKTVLNNAAFSISIWANPTTLGFSKFLFSANNGGSQRFYLREDTGSQMTVGVSAWNQTTGSVFSTGSWHHFVIVYNGTGAQLYHNGSLLLSTANLTPDMPSGSISIGSDEQNTSSSYFAGSIDDVRIYNKALSAADVAGLYSAGGGSPPPPPPPSNFTLTVTKSGTGTGTVTGGSINCGSTCTMNGSGNVTLSAAAASDSTFASWSGGGCSGTGSCVVTLSSNQSVTATFNLTSNPPPNPGDTTPPVISAVNSGNPSSSGATITWTTDEVSDSQVQYGLTTAYGSNSALNSSAVTAHSVTLSGLTPNTTYHYVVVSADPSGNKSTSPDNTFTTPAGVQINGNDVTAASCSWDDIKSAVDQAQAGDTVHVPAGTCTWTKTFLLTKPITLMGAGMDVTTIINAVPNDPVSQGWPNNIPPQFMKVASNGPGLTRITGFTFDGGPGAKDQQNNGQFYVSGGSPNWRIDHNGFVVNRASMITVYQYPPGGLIDHNRFVTGGWYMAIYGKNGGSIGDPTWAQPSNLGTDNAVYIEDNTFTSTSADGSPALDGWLGEKMVVRYNTFTMTRFSNHGTETSTRERSARTFEVYNNVMNYPGSGITNTAADAIQIRGGTGVIFNNVITGKIPQIGRFSNYRDVHSYWSPFNQCDGYSAYDKNDLDSSGRPMIYDSGTATADGPYTNGSTVMTTTGKSWTASQWRGYSIKNMRSGLSSVISSNTATTITSPTEGSNGPAMSWKTGDSYQITRAVMCLDQVGVGQGTLLSNFSNPTPATWLNQVSDPAYAWNNSYNGTVKAMYSDSPHVVVGRDLFVSECKPGYTPYTYPHPLTGLPPQSVALNCGGGGGSQNFTLTVTKTGTGSGTVSGGSISCGSTCSYTGTGSVFLTATPAAGSTFTGWSGACTGTSVCSLTLSSNLSVTANFTAGPGTKTLTVTKSGTGTGTVSGGTISCGTSCTQAVTTGGTVTLTAAPTNSSTFAGWNVSPASSGSCSTALSCALTLAADTTVTATFSAAANLTPDVTPPTVSITSPVGGSTVSGTVNLAALANDPQSPTGAITSGLAGVQFKVDGNNLGSELTAVFSGTWDTTPVSNGQHTITAVARDAAGNRTTSSAVTVTVNNVQLTPDVTAPSIPANFAASAVSAYQVNLTWSPSTDIAVNGAVTSGVSGYKIYVNGTSFTTVSGTAYTFIASPSTSYSFAITAYDAAGNFSAQTGGVEADTPAAPPKAPTPLIISDGAPWQELAAGTKSATLVVKSNRAATCEYSLKSTTSYGSGTRFATTGGTRHESPISGLSNGKTYTYYVLCQDSNGTASLGSYLISFAVAKTIVTETGRTVTNPKSTGSFTPTVSSVKSTKPVSVTHQPTVTIKPFKLDVKLASYDWLFNFFSAAQNILWAVTGL